MWNTIRRTLTQLRDINRELNQVAASEKANRAAYARLAARHQGELQHPGDIANIDGPDGWGHAG